MKSRYLNILVILMSLLLVLGSCSKYDEGPIFSLYVKDKRVQGRWYFSTVKYNDVDSTDVYKIDPMQTLEFANSPDKDDEWSAYTWSRNSIATSSLSYGLWKFNEEKDSLKMVNTVTVYEAGGYDSDTVEYNWKINRLAYTEFWLERQADDSTLIAWKLWKIAY